MTKKEFIDQVTEASQQPRTNVMAVTDAVFTVIADLVCNDDTVNIPGFGIFASKTRPARQGKNPATGESITIPAKRVAVFKPAKALKDTLNG